MRAMAAGSQVQFLRMKVRATVSTSPPLFVALADSLERQIREGVYQAGEKLPSLREIAALRSYGKNTVISAFELLVSRGLLEPRRGSGFLSRRACLRAARWRTTARCTAPWTSSGSCACSCATSRGN